MLFAIPYTSDQKRNSLLTTCDFIYTNHVLPSCQLLKRMVLYQGRGCSMEVTSNIYQGCCETTILPSWVGNEYLFRYLVFNSNPRINLKILKIFSRNSRVDYLSVCCRPPKCPAQRLGRVLVVVDYRMSLR